LRVVNNAPGLLSTTIHLTAAQIRTLNSAPVTIIPAPGAGRIVAVDSMALIYDFGAHIFDAQVIPQPVVQYASLPGTALLTLPPVILEQTSSQFSFSNTGASGSSFAQSTIANQAIQFSDLTDYDAGPILTASLGAGGTGYAVGDTGTIQQNNNDATYQITSVGALGVVTGFTITGNGTQYVTANGVPTATGGAQPGVGTGFTVNITAVTLGDGTLKVITYYQIVPVP
jgi:hypothetical protein